MANLWGAAKSIRNSAGHAAAGDPDILSEDFKEHPYWWDNAPAPLLPVPERPARVDVAVVGSGYTGLNAALETARAGRSTLVLDAEQAGWGCSTRNGGQISTSIKPAVPLLARRHGIERARAIHEEGRASLEWIEELVKREGIDCGFQRKGRFHAAHGPAQFQTLVASAEAQGREGVEAHVVPRSEQRSELGTDSYHGGVVFPRHAALDPAKYHQGLLARVIEAGASVLPHCPVLSIERIGKDFALGTADGTIKAGAVIVATNGYSGALLPWLRRRVIPIGSYIIATEPLAPGLIDQLFPTDRIASDTCRVVYYYRASPDRSRVLFGGRASANETNHKISAQRLHADMVRIFPELSRTRITHSWSGTVAYSFDHLAHCGVHDGIHYAASYCGSGVSMASYLGMRTGQRVLGLKEGNTAFDNLPFPTRPLYSGNPWFLPAMVSWYRWRDRIEWARAMQATG